MLHNDIAANVSGNPFRPFAMACRTLCGSGFNRDCEASQAGHNRPSKIKRAPTSSRDLTMRAYGAASMRRPQRRLFDETG